MKSILFTISIFLIFTSLSKGQMVQSNYEGIIVPKNICSGGTTRLPYIYRAKVTGLSANTKYRYYTQAVRYTDFGGTNSGAGNPVLINGSNFRYTTSTSLSNPAGYDSLITDASGSYTGWFGFLNTGNARFTAGNYVYPSITLDSAGNGTAKYRFALNDSMLVLGFSDSATVTSGTGLYGVSFANAKNIITVYDNVNNTGRPLSVVYVESAGFDTTSMPSLVQYYKDSVITRNGRWGTVIPNILPSGVRRVNVLRLSDASIANSSTDADGNWPSGINTVNPSGGSVNPLRLNQQDVPLIVKTGNTVPDNFILEQNYPNPFNPSTTINFSIPVNGNVELKLFDILGKEVQSLLKGTYNSGSYSLNFNGSNLQSGIYFYSLNLNGDNGVSFTDRKKLILIK